MDGWIDIYLCFFSFHPLVLSSRVFQILSFQHFFFNFVYTYTVFLGYFFISLRISMIVLEFYFLLLVFILFFFKCFLLSIFNLWVVYLKSDLKQCGTPNTRSFLLGNLLVGLILCLEVKDNVGDYQHSKSQVGVGAWVSLFSMQVLSYFPFSV